MTITDVLIWNQETAKIIIDGWIHTGDKGYYDEDERLFVIGRYKELIKYRMAHVSNSFKADSISNFTQRWSSRWFPPTSRSTWWLIRPSRTPASSANRTTSTASCPPPSSSSGSVNRRRPRRSSVSSTVRILAYPYTCLVFHCCRCLQRSMPSRMFSRKSHVFCCWRYMETERDSTWCDRASGGWGEAPRRRPVHGSHSAQRPRENRPPWPYEALTQ